VTPARGIPIGIWWRPAALTNSRAIGAGRRLLAVIMAGGLLVACENLIAALPNPVAVPASSPSKVNADGALSMLPIAFKDVPGWKADHHSQALPVFLRSCARLRKQPPDQAMGPRTEMGTVAQWTKLCDDAKVIRPGNDTEARYFFESRFLAYGVFGDGKSAGLITGYYEPELRGAWKADARYRYPLYALPKDLVSADLGGFDDKWRGEQIAGRMIGKRFVPYQSRAEIETGALAGRQLEIIWVDNPIDSFFLHIQGSGRILLADGSHVRVGYAGRNGRRYTAVGRELVGAGVLRLKDVTMPTIRQWMEANPVAGQALMRKNQSFVFFRVLQGNGPLGAQGVVLTPLRSLAVDRRFLPLGAPLWLVTTDPGTKPLKPLRRLVVAQDTGSAIRGVVRGDLFWGHGNKAGDKAGIMKQRGRLYLLLPRTAASKSVNLPVE